MNVLIIFIKPFLAILAVIVAAHFLSKKTTRLWSWKALAEDFAENRINSRTSFSYLIAFVLLIYLSIMGAANSVREPYDLISSVTFVCIGLFVCSSANYKVDSQNFTDRMVAFFVLGSLRFFAAVLAVVVICGLLLMYLPVQNDEAGLLYDALRWGANALMYGYFFWFIRRGILKISEYRKV